MALGAPGRRQAGRSRVWSPALLQECQEHALEAHTRVCLSPVSALFSHKAKLITIRKQVHDSRLDDNSHVVKLGFLHSTQSRREDKPHNKQANRRVQEVNEPNAKSVCGVQLR